MRAAQLVIKGEVEILHSEYWFKNINRKLNKSLNSQFFVDFYKIKLHSRNQGTWFYILVIIKLIPMS